MKISVMFTEELRENRERGALMMRGKVVRSAKRSILQAIELLNELRNQDLRSDDSLAYVLHDEIPRRFRITISIITHSAAKDSTNYN
jgi:hypothetical protein